MKVPSRRQFVDKLCFLVSYRTWTWLLIWSRCSEPMLIRIMWRHKNVATCFYVVVVDSCKERERCATFENYLNRNAKSWDEGQRDVNGIWKDALSRIYGRQQRCATGLKGDKFSLKGFLVERLETGKVLQISQHATNKIAGFDPPRSHSAWQRS